MKLYFQTDNLGLVVALDKSAAFDTLDWNKIINNLIKNNVDNSVIKLVESLFVDRRIMLNNTYRNTVAHKEQNATLYCGEFFLMYLLMV